MSKLSLETVGDTHVVVKRRFNASPEAVYEAHLDPDLVKQWMLGPPGWSMPVCTCEAKVGGGFRYEWSDGNHGFFSTGKFLALEPFSRIVHVEQMFLPDPTPENHVETTFTADGTGTLLVMRMTLPDADSRTAMLASGMEHGMEDSYARLDKLAM